MSRKKTKNEASSTANIMGYLPGGHLLSIYKKNKKDVPWYLKRGGALREMVLEELSVKKIVSLLEADDDQKARKASVDDPEVYFKQLKKQLRKAEQQASQNPWDSTPSMKAKALRGQIERAKKAVEVGGKDWRKYMTDPKPKKPEPKKDPKYSLRQGGDDKLRDVVGALIHKYEEGSSPEIDQIKQEKGKLLQGVIKRLKQFRGDLPVDQDQHDKISSWIKNVLIGQHKGNLSSYLASKPEIAGKRHVGGARGGTKVRGSQSKRTAPGGPTQAATYRDEPMPGAEKDFGKLHKSLSKTPEHEQSPFAPPGGGYGPRKSFGSAGNILKKLYGQLATEYLYGKGGAFDDLVSAVEKRHAGVDLSDALERYSQLAQQGDIDDPSDLDEREFQNQFSPEEAKALGELSKLADPQTHAAIRSNDFTEFEKALGPMLRDLYGQKGHQVKDETEEKEQERKELGFSKAMRLSLSRRLGVPLQAVEATMSDLPGEERKRVEQQALMDLKKISPGVFKAELAMRKKRKQAQADTEAEKQAKKLVFKKREDPEGDIAYEKGMSALDKAIARKKEMGTGVDEPRDPEELARRRAMEPEFRAAAQSHQGAMGDLKQRQKQRLIDLIQKSREKRKMASNESFNFSLAEMFGEGFENSYELDPEYSEKAWEDGETENKKDWKKELSLESLMRQLEKSK